MKVVQLLPELNEGGVERGTVELSRELVKQGVESIVVSAGGKLAQQIDRDGGMHLALDTCSKNPISAPLRIHRLRRLLQQVEPDILHARSRVPAWLTYLANRTLNRPFVTTVHGFNSVNAYSRVMTFGDRVICVSSAIKDYIQRNYQVAEGKITVIPRGIDLELFDPAHLDREFIRRFQKEHRLDGRFVVSAIGRITQLKDYETFIRGIVAASEKRPEICGLVVGGVRQDKRDYYASLKHLVAELGAGELIRFCGSQSRVAEIYGLSDIVAVCSKKPESFGRTAAEALAMNVPVVATRHGGVLDLVISGRTGFLFEPGDVKGLAEAIEATVMLADTDYRSFITDHFSLRRMVDATLSVYRDLRRESAPEQSGEC